MKSLDNLSKDLLEYLHKKNVLRQLIRAEIISFHLTSVPIEQSIVETTKDNYRKRFS